jgi:hypothetical protein
MWGMPRTTASTTEGWFVGGFVKADNAWATEDVEVKWSLSRGRYPAWLEP